MAADATHQTITHTLTLGKNAGSNGRYQIFGGTLTAGDIVVGAAGSGTFTQSGGVVETGSINGGAGTSSYLFDGGTIRATQGSATFLQGLTTAKIAGGLNIDTNGHDITVAQDIVQTDPNVRDRGLEKFGAGTVTFTGAVTFNGALQGGPAGQTSSGDRDV